MRLVWEGPWYRLRTDYGVRWFRDQRWESNRGGLARTKAGPMIIDLSAREPWQEVTVDVTHHQ